MVRFSLLLSLYKLKTIKFQKKILSLFTKSAQNNKKIKKKSHRKGWMAKTFYQKAKFR